MNIAVFFHAYEPYHEMKDPAQIVFGLNDIGLTCEMITFEKQSLKGYSAIPIRTISPQKAKDVNFWQGVNYDVIIAYTWLREDFLWIPSVLKKGNKIVIVKSDTDGRYNFPIYPRWDTYIGSKFNIRSLKILRRRMKRRLYGKQYAQWLAEHINLADGVVVETPQAFANLASILSYWETPHLLKKINIIPNSVANDIFEVETTKKEKLIAAIGNWDGKFGDYYQKNTETMVKVFKDFILNNAEYKIGIFGLGDNIVKDFLNKYDLSRSGRIQVFGHSPHIDIVNFLGKSQIFFMPSIAEASSIAANEAVCMGCSIVGSPLECLQFLTHGGFSGTLAPDFTVNAYLGALISDTIKWERGEYLPENISSFWRARLNRKKIALHYKALAIKLCSK